jgi:DNA/RNA endonuclease G (NUC1)
MNTLNEIINFMVLNLKVSKLTFLVLILFASCTKPEPTVAQELREQVEVITPIFTVLYSETKEQPITLTYRSTNRPKNVDRGSMNFYTEDEYHTSDNADYYRNIYDKGHLAPAATFSDSIENLKQTFSYLNCALQDQYLNRGQWRLLEEQERDWDDESDLTVKIDLVWDEGYLELPTGGHVPTDMIKHIYFEKTGSWKCFEFENVKPIKGWEEHEVIHNHE